jgi:hypothetical protein
MLPIKSWRIYYADGSTFDSTQGTFAEAPPFGVQCVVYYHDPPYKTLSGPDGDGVFWFHGEEGNLAGLKMGMWQDSEGLHRIMKMATESTPPQWLPEGGD